MDLVNKTCVPCRGGVPPITGQRLKDLQEQLGGDWQICDEHHLRKQYLFKNFALALAYVNRIGAVAEQQGHHPDIHLAWGKVVIEMWTHKIDGLTESDFIMAAKFDDAASS